MRGLNKKAKTLFAKVEIDGTFKEGPSGMSEKLTEQTQELSAGKYDRVLQAPLEKPGSSREYFPDQTAPARVLRHDFVSVPTAAEHLPAVDLNVDLIQCEASPSLAGKPKSKKSSPSKAGAKSKKKSIRFAGASRLRAGSGELSPCQQRQPESAMPDQSILAKTGNVQFEQDFVELNEAIRTSPSQPALEDGSRRDLSPKHVYVIQPILANRQRLGQPTASFQNELITGSRERLRELAPGENVAASPSQKLAANASP